MNSPEQSKALRRRPAYFRRSLQLVALAAFVPVLFLQGVSLYVDFRNDSETASSSVERQSQAIATTAGVILDQAELAARLLATRVLVVEAARAGKANCSGVFHGLQALPRVFAEVALTDVQGRRLCGWSSTSERPTVAPDDPLVVGSAIRAGGPLLSPPLRRKQDGPWVAAFTFPVFDDNKTVGLVIAYLDLMTLSSQLADSTLGEGWAVSLVNGRSRILARAPGADKFIGTELPPDLAALRAAHPEGTFAYRAVDGVVRLVSSTSLERYGLRVAVGAPYDDIYRENRKQFRAEIAATILLGVFILVVTFVVSRRLAQPVDQMVRAVRDVAKRKQGAQMPQNLPGEFAVLAQEFDNLLKERDRKERELSGVVETALNAVLTVSAEYKIALFNTASTYMFQVDRFSALGRNVSELFAPHCTAAVLQHIQQVLALKQPRRVPGSAGMECLRGDGTQFPAELSMSFFGEESGGFVTVVVRDITSEREAERGREARMAAEAANLAKTKFLSKVGHELRTPLNAILGFSRLIELSAGERLTEDERKKLGLVQRAGKQLQSLVDDVVDVTRIEAGVLSVELQDVELTPLLDEVVAITSAHANAANVAVGCGYQSLEQISVHADPLRLRQVLTNLVSNAIKYNRPGGDVWLGVTVKAGYVEILCKDSGLGMTQAQLSQLFQPFNRLGRERSSVDGTGIGLVLARDLLELMGGSIEVFSRPAIGTDVKVLLPRVQQARAAAQTAAALEAPEAVTPQNTAHNLVTGSVLYIEDNPVNVFLVEQLISKWANVATLVAADGVTGLDIAKTHKPDVILLDMQLPDCSGVDVLEGLKGDEKTRSIPVIALSASAMKEEVDEALKAGAVAYWTKPVDFDEFWAKLPAYLPSRSEA